MNNPLFLIIFSTAFLFFLAGMVMQLFPPREINRTYGYRSKSAMQDHPHWEFAQTYCSHQLIFLGMVLALISVVGVFARLSTMFSVFIGCGVFFMAAMLLRFRVELAIKKKFSKQPQ